MRTLAATLLLAAMWIPVLGQERTEAVPKAKYFSKAEDVQVERHIDHSGKGTFVNLTPIKQGGGSDTLRVWVQGVRWPNQPPNRDSARAADRVIWCYPQRFESSKHVLPGVEGRVLFKESSDTFAVMSERLYERVH